MQDIMSTNAHKTLTWMK